MENVLTRKMAKDGHPTEGPIAKGIEKQTAKIPSDVFLWAAIGSMATSLTLKLAGRKHDALFIGQWAAPFLLLGLYNKLVKIGGHDREDQDANEDDGLDLQDAND